MMYKVQPVINLSVRGLCIKSYEGHPKGCPNWNCKPSCPPFASTIDKLIDLEKPIFLIYNCFDLANHVNNLRAKHPNWSDRQLKCCLYWQGTARKQLRGLIKENVANLVYEYPDYKSVILNCPEACGVDVTATMKSIGVELEWPPQKYTYQVALIGFL